MANRRKKDEKKIGLKEKFRRIAWGRYLAIVALSAWMFILGILVGRGTAPVKFDIKRLSEELAELRAADLKKLMAPVELEADEEKTKTTLGFYEELKKNEPDVSAAGKPDADAIESPRKPQNQDKQTAPRSATDVKDKPQPEETATAKKEPAAKAPQKKPVKTTKPAKKEDPSAGGATTNGKEMTIQVASLKALNDADEMVKKLNDKGYPAYKTIAIVPDKGIWFRIRVGRFSSQETLDDMIGRLKKDGYRPMAVERQ